MDWVPTGAVGARFVAVVPQGACEAPELARLDRTDASPLQTQRHGELPRGDHRELREVRIEEVAIAAHHTGVEHDPDHAAPRSRRVPLTSE